MFGYQLWVKCTFDQTEDAPELFDGCVFVFRSLKIGKRLLLDVGW
jgi:hypothetical protein